MVKDNKKKVTLAYIVLSVALMLSLFLGITFAWFTDTKSDDATITFGEIKLGSVTANAKTNVVAGDTIGGTGAGQTSLGSFTYQANSENAYWRATYEITDIAAGELDAYFGENPIAPEFGEITGGDAE